MVGVGYLGRDGVGRPGKMARRYRQTGIEEQRVLTRPIGHM